MGKSQIGRKAGALSLGNCFGCGMKYLPVDQRTRIRLLQAAGLVLGPALILCAPILSGDIHEVLEYTGLTLVLACIAGRMWSILYIGTQKNSVLTTSGPYSTTRNPLYFFSTLGAVGIGLLTGSILAAAIFGLLAYAILHATAVKEAAHLRNLFGPRYEEYERRTPSFWPDISLYSDQEEVTFSPVALKRTFLDGLVFLAAFPLIEFSEHLQALGYLPTLILLP
jgi:protein-S-isoprenylcysteine O-methyltransferase Ste14